MAQFQAKQGAAAKALVFLKDVSTGNPKTGIAFGSVTVYLTKAGAAPALKAVIAADWTELSAANMPGWYTLQLSAADLDTTPVLGFVVTAAGATQFNDMIEVVATLASDVNANVIFNRRVLEGRWKIDSTTNKLTIFSNDGTTILQQFDLKDSLGNPTATAIFERVPNTATYPIP